MTQHVGEEQGYRLEFLHISYQCPALKLYGYATERQLRSAVRRELKKRAKAAKAADVRLIVHPTAVAAIHGTPAIHKADAPCPLCAQRMA